MYLGSDHKTDEEEATNYLSLSASFPYFLTCVRDMFLGFYRVTIGSTPNRITEK